jgi:hypothetical protein
MATVATKEHLKAYSGVFLSTVKNKFHTDQLCS